MNIDRFGLGSRYDLSALSVLIVEDHSSMQKLLRTILTALGIVNVREAFSGEEGFQSLMEFPADLVITDWNMSPMDGLTFVKTVRNDERSPNPYVPIIMLTGQAEKQRVIEARNAGVNMTLTKPVSAKTLAERVTMLIEEPVPFVRTKQYFGPDRRRIDGPHNGKERRRKPDTGWQTS